MQKLNVADRDRFKEHVRQYDEGLDLEDQEEKKRNSRNEVTMPKAYTLNPYPKP